MIKFKIGQRVKTKHKILGMGKGYEGTIRVISSDFYGVEFDKYVGGHCLNDDYGNDNCLAGYGYWLFEMDIEPCCSFKRIN